MVSCLCILTQMGFSAFICGDGDTRTGRCWRIAGRIRLASLVTEIGNVATAEQLIAHGLTFVKRSPGGTTNTTREAQPCRICTDLHNTTVLLESIERPTHRLTMRLSSAVKPEQQLE